MIKALLLTTLVLGNTAIASATVAKGKVAPTAQKTQQSEYCELTDGKDQKSWDKCIGKTVKIQGKVPRVVMAHIQRNSNFPGEKSVSQSYMDALNYQFVLLSAQPIACSKAFEVEGTLRRFSSGKSANGKASYSNYDIHVNKFICLGK